jgi:hypothetical protein
VSKGIIVEDAPTNSMGASSSTQGSGPIDTYDPKLKSNKKKLLPFTVFTRVKKQTKAGEV